ncbi:MAG TPA: AtpZ/AtpI family protein [Verrucomicrobiae bacterium]|nr:AtpZ/AtpI family protein [Verrucomicrobiae bacterium]
MTDPSLNFGRKTGQTLTQLALIIELPVTLVAGVLVFGGIGYFVDRWLKTGPVFLLVLGAAGFGLGLWKILQKLSRMEKDDGGRS